MNAYLVKLSLRTIAVVAVCGAVSACATNPQTDPSSPLVAEIERTVSQKRDYPRLQDFPAAPVNVPTPAYVRASVGQLEQSQAVLNREVTAIDWTLDDDAEAYAAALRQRIAQDRVEIPTLSTPAEIEAFAQSLRQRAKAPPPVDRPIR